MVRILTIGAFLTICMFQLSCSPRSRPLSSLNAILLGELCSHKIVMIGDSFHGHGYYERLVTGFLNSWLDEFGKGEENPKVPKKLVLFLEAVQSQNDEMLAFMKTGDLEAYLNHSLEMSVKWGGMDGGHGAPERTAPV